MAAPTNISALTATVIPSLPYSTTQQVDDSGTLYTVWYVFVATVAEVWAGLYARGAASYEVDFTIYTGSAVSPTPVGVNGTDVPANFTVTAGQSYFLKFAPKSGSSGTAILTVELERGPNDNVPVGTIGVPNDQPGHPMVFVDTNGDVVRQVTDFPSGESGDTLTDGTVAMFDQYQAELGIYDSNYNLLFPVITSIDDVCSLGGCLRTCVGTQNFWVTAFQNVGGAQAIKVSPDGTVGPSHGTLTGMQINCGAANNDESIFYYATGGFGANAIKRWNLNTDTQMADFVTGITGVVFDILVLGDNSVVFSYIANTPGANDVQVFRYNAAGTLLNTYLFGSAFVYPAGTLPRLAYDPASTSFWLWTHPDGADEGFSRFEQVRVSDGVILQTVLVAEYEEGIYQPTSGTPADERFGVSFSCPFWIVRVAFPDADTGTIVVVKETQPNTNTTAFTFTAGGGLTPTSFTLAHGETQTFNSVPAGEGYSIVETLQSGYQSVISVSNHSSPTNISVAADETVTVLVRNSTIFIPTTDVTDLPLRRLRIGPHLSNNGAMQFLSSFQLDCVVGQGLTEGVYADAEIILRLSRDGGWTWGVDHVTTLGVLGNYLKRVKWEQLGQGRDIVAMVIFSSPIELSLNGAWITARSGTS